jgi:hypothetical protein
MKSLSCPSRRCSRSRKSAARSIFRHGFYTTRWERCKVLSVVHGSRDGSLATAAPVRTHSTCRLRWNSGWNVASHHATHSTNGIVDRLRPLCPYAKVAVYKGKGNTNDAGELRLPRSGCDGRLIPLFFTRFQPCCLFSVSQVREAGAVSVRGKPQLLYADESEDFVLF